MATIAIGDIHGNLPALVDLLAQLRPEVAVGDTVVFLGDYVDRGPDSRQCIDAILDFRARIPAEVVCLRGNHEDWLLRTQSDYTRHSWLFGMDAFDTVASYSPDAVRILRDAMGEQGARVFERPACALPYEAFFDAWPASHVEFFATLALCIETADCICSHAGVDPAIAALRDQPSEVLIWGHGWFQSTYDGAVPVVYGHWNNADLDRDRWPLPHIVGNTFGIDTISHGVLTAIRLPDRQIFQTARHNVTKGAARG